MTIAQQCIILRYSIFFIFLCSIIFLLYYNPNHNEKSNTKGHIHFSHQETKIHTINPIQLISIKDITIVPNKQTKQILEDTTFLSSKKKKSSMPINNASIPFANIKKIAKKQIVVDKPTQYYNQLKNTPAYPKIGIKNFQYHLQNTLQYPKKAQENNIQGIVFVKCTVNIQGILKNITILKGIGGGCDKEAIRIVQNTTEKWFPAKKAGKKVESTQIIRISFFLPE